MNGFLVADEREMAEAVRWLGRIDPRSCRRSAERFSPQEVARRYEQVYYAALGERSTANRRRSAERLRAVAATS